MGYRIVFFDLDGTLLNEEKQIPKETLDAIRELQRWGIITAIATGRAPYFFQQIAEQLNIASFVCLNGSYVVHEGEPIFRSSIPTSRLEQLVEQSARCGHPLVFQGAEAYCTTDAAHPRMVESVATLRVAMPGQDPDYWRKTDIYQAFLHCEEHEESLYDLPGLKLVRWHKKAVDILPTNMSKGRGIKEMLRQLGLTPADAVAFGDNLNDMEMLSLVGLGIAMGNSHRDLLPYADYVTTDVNNGGITGGLRHAGLIN